MYIGVGVRPVDFNVVTVHMKSLPVVVVKVGLKFFAKE